MYRFSIKFFKYSILGFLPFLLISSSGNELEFIPNETLVHKNSRIPSQLSFELEAEKSEDGLYYKKLTLVFFDCDSEGAIELVIMSRGNDKYLSNEVYTINHIDGFLNGFEGVFGVFTNKDFGEKPFFANKGFVQINKLKDEHIQGYLDITLLNNNGKTIRISDSFQNF